MVKVFAPGTIGNVGPGFDVLGLAVADLGDFISMERSHTTTIRVKGRDADLIPVDPKKNTVSIAANYFLKKYSDEPLGLSIEIDRNLPSSGGLGASASSSVAGAIGAAALMGMQSDTQAVIEAALVAEEFVAGRHLDNIAPCIYGGMTIVQSVDPVRIYPVPLNLELYVLLLTPNVKIKTKDSRNVLPTSLPQAEWVRQMANTASLVNGFASSDLEMIKVGLVDEYGEKYRKKLIPKFEDAKDIAMGAGALGFSISGAGPTCFGLYDSKNDAES